MKNGLILLILSLFFCKLSYSQKKDSVASSPDSLQSLSIATTDTVKKRVHSPRKAALRSAVLPGWGQIYNKKYWKLPLVYGALGVTAYAFNFNITQYKRISYAYRLLINRDTVNFKNVDADLQPFIKANASNDLRNYRNEFRRDIDYSVLIFLLFWGLNVVDATVDAHLKGFNVSDDLSLKIKPGYSPVANTTGISLVLDIHKGNRAILPLPH
ncbi:MAG: DUF5683 domain-containing protein [Chitinophagaceae bacterium]